jgi:hypothetical protein
MDYPMASLHAHILDVGVARLGDPQPVQAEQHGQCGVGVVEALGGEQEPGKLAAVEAPPLGGVEGGEAHVLGRVRGDTAIDVANR